MSSMTAKMLALAVLVCCFYYVNAQSNQNESELVTPVTLPSPNAQALGKFGVIPVSNYTGIASVSLPLFSLKAGKYELPVSLDYHASGIKVNELGSNVGMGWSLNAGGNISRQVMGHSKDEKLSLGFLANCIEVSQMPTTQTQGYPYPGYAQNGLKDGQPDRFSFNFAGKSGNFVLDCNSQAVLDTYSKVKIVLKSRTADDITSWEITDEDGTRYLFNQYETSLTEATYVYPQICGTPIPSNAGNPITGFVNTSWYLTQITTPRGELINFLYEDYRLEYSLFADETAWNFDPQGTGGSNYCGITMTHQKYVVFGKRLASITAPSTGQKVEFTKGAIRYDMPSNLTIEPTFRYADYSVASVRLKNTDGTNQQYDLSYAYQNNTASLLPASNVSTYNAGYRLMLSSIKLSGDGIQAPPYTFTYFSGFGFPPRISFAVDEMGFYNGMNSNTTSIKSKWNLGPWAGAPKCTTCDSEAICDNRYDFSKAIIGTLKEIRYPTGGVTKLTYEFSGTEASEVRAIRIQKLENTDRDEVTETTEYSYPQERGLYNFNIGTTSSVQKPLDNVPNGCRYIRIDNKHSKSKFVYDFTTRGHVVYPVVVERKTHIDANNLEKSNGRTEYTYSFAEDDYFPTSGEVGIIDYSWKRGWPRNTKYFDADGILQKEIIMSYKNSENDATPASVVAGKSVFAVIAFNSCGLSCEIPSAGCISLTKFARRSNYYYMDQQREIFYNPDQTVLQENVSNFEYSPNHLQLIRQSVIQSDGQEKKVEYRYASDILGAACQTSSDVNVLGLKEMVAQNWIQNAVETTAIKNGVLVDSRLSTYRVVGTRIQPDAEYSIASYPVSDASFVRAVVSGASGTGCSSTFVKDGRYEKNIQYEGYDDVGNIRGYVKRGGMPTGRQYGYSNAVPVAEAVNARYSEIFYDGFEGNTLWSTTAGSVLRTSHAGNTGDKCVALQVSPSIPRSTYVKSFFPPTEAGKTYTLRAWVKGKGLYFRIIHWLGASNSLSYVSPKTTQEDWHWHTWNVTIPNGGGPAMEINLMLDYAADASAICYVDEVKVRPPHARMVTYTYNSFFQITAKKDDNAIGEYYEYDGIGRIIAIRNEKREIIRTFTYHFGH